MAATGVNPHMNWQEQLRRIWQRVTSPAGVPPVSTPVEQPLEPAPQSAHDRLLSYIRQHGTASGLDLSDADLTGAVLDGLNLDGIQLGDYARQRGAQLSYASMVGTSLRGATICYVDCTGAKMRRADLTAADLSYAILDHADLRWATLVEADLYRGSLEHTLLSPSNLHLADLYLARLDNTKLVRADLHAPLLHEDKVAYARFLDQLSARRGRSMSSLSPPLERSFEIYQALKTNWRAIGRSDDASWAYERERRAERAMHAPWRATAFFGGRLRAGGRRNRPLRLAAFYLGHTAVWGLSWLAYLTCGYGERPWRTLTASAVVIATFPLLYWASAGVATSDHEYGRDLLIYSLGVFSGANLTNIKPTNWQAELLTGIEASLGLSLFALLMFTLGNRLSRL